MAQEPTAVILAADIVKWLTPKVGRFPRHVRYGIGLRLEALHLEVLEEIIVAQYTKGHDRARALDRANRSLQVGRHLGRIACELGHFSHREALHLATLQVELGKQVGGWRRASVDMVSSSSSSAIQAI